MDIKVTSICALNLSDDWETSCQQLKDYCSSNDAGYYSTSKEKFSIPKAIDFARSHGFKEIVVEDLS